MVTNPSFNDHTKPSSPKSLWITASAAADAAIAIGLQVVSRRGPLPFHGPSFYLSLASRHFAVRLRVGVIGAAFSIAVRCLSSCQTNREFTEYFCEGSSSFLRNPNLRDPKPAEVRQSLPHATSSSYPFMPDTSGNSQEMQKKGGRPFISAPLPLGQLGCVEARGVL
ncbi:hypothetical protein B0H13DRAFT_2086744, partial [Mycena leptocephala]